MMNLPTPWGARPCSEHGTWCYVYAANGRAVVLCESIALAQLIAETRNGADEQAKLIADLRERLQQSDLLAARVLEWLDQHGVPETSLMGQSKLAEHWKRWTARQEARQLANKGEPWPIQPLTLADCEEQLAMIQASSATDFPP